MASLRNLTKESLLAFEKASAEYAKGANKVLKNKTIAAQNQKYLDGFKEPLDRMAVCVHTPKTKILSPGFVFIAEGPENCPYWTLEEFEKNNK